MLLHFRDRYQLSPAAIRHIAAGRPSRGYAVENDARGDGRFGDDVLLATGQSPSEFADEARLLLAAKLYELGRLSSGRLQSYARWAESGFSLPFRASG